MNQGILYADQGTKQRTLFDYYKTPYIYDLLLHYELKNLLIHFSIFPYFHLITPESINNTQVLRITTNFMTDIADVLRGRINERKKRKKKILRKRKARGFSFFSCKCSLTTQASPIQVKFIRIC